MNTCTMYDSVDAGNLPDGNAYAAYVNGDYKNYSQVHARFPRSKVFGIDITGEGWQTARILDYEPGNPCYAPLNLHSFAMNRELFRPHTTCIYADRDNLDDVESILAGMWHVLWVSTLDGTKMTGQRTRSGTLIVGTQYATNDDYDTSEVLTSWTDSAAPWS
jgi:hypothetical protein